MEDRRRRALTQRILLVPDGIDVIDETHVVVRVIGASGSHYRVKFSSCSECDCPDYKNRLLPCKHIFFVLHRVLLLEAKDIGPSVQFTTKQTGEYVKFIEQVRKPQLSIEGALHVAPSESLGDRQMVVPPKAIDDQDECPICLDAFDAENEELTHCSTTCGTNFHWICLNRCREKRCPMCRAENRSWPRRKAR
jgi:hypothetical protein